MSEFKNEKSREPNDSNLNQQSFSGRGQWQELRIKVTEKNPQGLEDLSKQIDSDLKQLEANRWHSEADHLIKVTGVEKTSLLHFVNVIQKGDGPRDVNGELDHLAVRKLVKIGESFLDPQVKLKVLVQLMNTSPNRSLADPKCINFITSSILSPDQDLQKRAIEEARDLYDRLSLYNQEIDLALQKVLNSNANSTSKDRARQALKHTSRS